MTPFEAFKTVACEFLAELIAPLFVVSIMLLPIVVVIVLITLIF